MMYEFCTPLLIPLYGKTNSIHSQKPVSDPIKLFHKLWYFKKIIIYLSSRRAVIWNVIPEKLHITFLLLIGSHFSVSWSLIFICCQTLWKRTVQTEVFCQVTSVRGWAGSVWDGTLLQFYHWYHMLWRQNEDTPFIRVWDLSTCLIQEISPSFIAHLSLYSPVCCTVGDPSLSQPSCWHFEQLGLFFFSSSSL